MHIRTINILFSICLLTLSIDVSAATTTTKQPKDFIRTQVAKDYRNIKNKAESGRLVRVIVKPKIDAQFLSSQKDKTLRFNAAKNKFTDKGLNPQRELKRSGLLVYEVDAEELDLLIDSGLVEQLQEDTLSSPQLIQSTEFIRANLTHNYGFSGAGQAIVILDTGVEASHPFLANRVVEEACFSSNSAYSTSLCPDGTKSQTGTGAGGDCSDTGIADCEHGTHVAGIAAGSGGIAPSINIVSVQVFSKFTGTYYCGSESSCVKSWDADQVAALEWVLSEATTPNIAAINMSIGGGTHYTYCDNDDRKFIIDSLASVGITTVISSGNSGYTNAVSAPACISSAVTVGSTFDSKNTISPFSNSASMVDILAPGNEITSSLVGGIMGTMSGTSMAAPHITGAIAVLKSVNPTATTADMEQSLKANGTNILDTRNGLTFPRLDLYASALSLENKPIARLDASSYSIILKKESAFSAYASSDPNGVPLIYNWNFGDGSVTDQTSTPTTTHSYQKIGTYFLDLTVDNGNRISDKRTSSVTVYNPSQLVVVVTSVLL